VFTWKTAAGLAAVAGTTTDPVQPIQDDGVGPVPATPIIEWLRHQDGPVEEFCQAMRVSTPAGLDAAGLIGVLQAVLDHHDALRLQVSAPTTGSPQREWALSVQPRAAVSAGDCLECVDATAMTGQDVHTRMVAEFDRARSRLDPWAGVMVQAVWFDAGPTHPGTLLMVIHHVAVDGVSWRVLLPDLHAAWEAIQANQPVRLPARSTSFRRWAQVLHAQARDATRVAELPVWQQLLAEATPLVPAVSGDTAGGVGGGAGRLSVRLDPAETQPLLGQVPAAFHAGVHDILLAGFGLALGEWTRRRGRGGGPVVVDVEGHGRDEGLASGVDLTRTVGWFTTLYPVRVDAGVLAWDRVQAAGPELGQWVKQVKESLRAVPAGGIGYGLLRYLNPVTGAVLAGYPGPDVGFNYLGRIPVSASGVPWTAVADRGGTALVGGGRPGLAPVYAVCLDAVTQDSAQGPCLVATWTWAEGLLTEGDVDELAQVWFSALRAITAHVTQSRGGGLTPSDVSLVGLTQHDIDQLEAELQADWEMPT